MPRFLREGIISLILLISTQVSANEKVLQACNPAQFKDTINFASDRSLAFAYLNSVNQENYLQKNIDSAIETVYKKLPIKADLSYAKTITKSIQQQTDMKLNTFQSERMLASYFSNNGSDNYKHCLNKLYERDNVYIFVKNNDKKSITFTVKLVGEKAATQEYKMTTEINGKPITLFPSSWPKNVSEYTKTYNRPVTNKTDPVTLDVNVELPGVTRYTDSVTVYYPYSIVPDADSKGASHGVKEVTSDGAHPTSAVCTGNTEIVHGATTSMFATESMQYFTNAEPIVDVKTPFAKGNSKVEAWVSDDGKVAYAKAYCQVATPKHEAQVVGRVKALLHTVKYKLVE